MSKMVVCSSESAKSMNGFLHSGPRNASPAHGESKWRMPRVAFKKERTLLRRENRRSRAKRDQTAWRQFIQKCMPEGSAEVARCPAICCCSGFLARIIGPIAHGVPTAISLGGSRGLRVSAFRAWNWALRGIAMDAACRQREFLSFQPSFDRSSVLGSSVSGRFRVFICPFKSSARLLTSSIHPFVASMRRVDSPANSSMRSSARLKP